MAGKRIKFALKMKDGVEVRTLQELKESFDLNQVVSYYLDGKLEAWLLDRYYEDLAEKIEELDKSNPELRRRLCEIFGVDYQEDAMSIEEIEVRNQRIKKMREITGDEEIIKNVDSVAFTQEELGDLLDEGVKTIYLCGSDFHIPMSKKGIKYIGIETRLNITNSEMEKYQLNDIEFVNLLNEKVVNKEELLMEIQGILKEIEEREYYFIVEPRHLNLEISLSEMSELTNKNYRSELAARKEGERRLKKAYDIVANCFDKNIDRNYAIQISDEFFQEIKGDIVRIATMLNGFDKETKTKNEDTLYQLNKELQLNRIYDEVKKIADEELDKYFHQLDNFQVYAKNITTNSVPDIDTDALMKACEGTKITVEGEMITVTRPVDFDEAAYQAAFLGDYYTFDACDPFERLRKQLFEWSEDYPLAVIARCKMDIIVSIYDLILNID